MCVRACACPCVSVQPGLHVPPPLSITKKIFLLYFGNQFHPFKKKKNLSLENGCCLIKLSFHGYCWVLLGFTMGLPGFTEFYLVFFSVFHLVHQLLDGCDVILLVFTEFYRVLLGFAVSEKERAAQGRGAARGPSYRVSYRVFLSFSSVDFLSLISSRFAFFLCLPSFTEFYWVCFFPGMAPNGKKKILERYSRLAAFEFRQTKCSP